MQELTSPILSSLVELAQAQNFRGNTDLKVKVILHIFMKTPENNN